MPRVNGTFNGSDRTFTVASGVSEVSAADLYSDWKDWAATDHNLRYAQAFKTSGGQPGSGGAIRGRYFDITNGWKIVINQSVNFIGNLFRDTDDPFGASVPVVKQQSGQVQATFNVSSLAEAVATASSGLTAGQIWSYDTRSLTQTLDPTAVAIAAQIRANLTPELQAVLDLLKVFGLQPGVSVTANPDASLITTSDDSITQTTTVDGSGNRTIQRT